MFENFNIWIVIRILVICLFAFLSLKVIEKSFHKHGNQLPHSKLWGLNEVFDLVLFWCCF